MIEMSVVGELCVDRGQGSREKRVPHDENTDRSLPLVRKQREATDWVCLVNSSHDNLYTSIKKTIV
jgi:hypothetical protein